MATKHLKVRLKTEWGRHRKGQVLDLNEPTAHTLVRKGIAAFESDEKEVVGKVRRAVPANK